MIPLKWVHCYFSAELYFAQGMILTSCLAIVTVSSLLQGKSNTRRSHCWCSKAVKSSLMYISWTFESQVYQLLLERTSNMLWYGNNKVHSHRRLSPPGKCPHISIPAQSLIVDCLFTLRSYRTTFLEFRCEGFGTLSVH